MRRAFTLACILGLMPTLAFGVKPVLLVDGREITDTRLESTKRAIMAQASGQKIPDDSLLRLAVDQVIGQALLVGAARDAGIVISAEEVDAALEAQREAAGGAEALAGRLKQAGLTEGDIRELAADRLAVQRFVQTVILPSIKVSDADLQAYYDSHPDEFKHEPQIKVWQVLSAIPPGATEEQRQAARAKAEQASARLRSGESFETVARELSDDPSKAQGGEVGWIRKGMLLPELEPVVLELAEGQTSSVLESQHGFHIFRVEARRGAGTYELDEIKPMLRGMLAQRDVGRALAEFVTEKRESASILALEPALEGVLKSHDGGAAPKP